MTSIDHIYRTTTGNYYPLKIIFSQIPVSQIPHDKSLTDQACKIGCNLFGRNGGCPPHSPSFDQISDRYEHSLVVMCKILTEHYPEKVLKGNYYVRWAFVETFLTSILTRIGHFLRNEMDGFLLGTGHCKGCGNKKCGFKTGEDSCNNPGKRLFSMESTGIIVTDLVEDVFDIRLQWWDKTNLDYIPDYMCKVTCLLSNNNNPYNEAEKLILKFLSL